MTTITRVGNIGNQYGGLNVKYEDGKHYWGICDYSDKTDWEEIPERLFIELINFNGGGDYEQ